MAHSQTPWVRQYVMPRDDDEHIAAGHHHMEQPGTGLFGSLRSSIFVI